MELTITDNSTTGMEESLEDTKLVEQFTTIMSTITALKSQIGALQNQIKGLEKGVKREVKNLKKEATRTKPKGNRKPSGFAKPTKISDELCQFMKKDSGAKVARTEVTQYLIEYIKHNNLQKPDNRKIIEPNSELRTLLGVQDKDEVTYFNLQRHMNKHFIKE